MSRRVPLDQPDAVWHLTARVNWQVFQLQPAAAYQTLLHHLRVQIRRYGLDLLAFVVMANHYHLVTRSPAGEEFRRLTTRRTPCGHRRRFARTNYKAQVIAQFAHDLQLAVSKEIQLRLGLEGHLWDGKQHRRLVQSLSDLIVTIAYDHRNPTVAGIVGRPELYERSSAAAWAGTGTSPCLLATRHDFPFGCSREEFRTQLLAFQESRKVDDVFRAWDKTESSPHTSSGRERLFQCMRDAGIVIPSDHGNRAAG
jgi:REP element-mobilizing transposase RayT